MIVNYKRNFGWTSLIAGMLLSFTANATNGYFLIGYGAKSRGMGGVGVANPVDAFAAAANPAGIAFVGSRGDIGAELFNPPRAASGGAADVNNFPTEFGYSADDVKSGANLFLIPSMAVAYKFNRKISVGFAAVGAGSNTRFNATKNFFSLTGVPAGEVSWGTLGVNLLQMQMLMTGTYKVHKNHSIGVSAVGAIQSFRAYGLGNFGGIFDFSSDVENLTNRGNDWSYGYGYRVGYLGNALKKRIWFGANYSSRVYMTEFKKYRGLFAEQGDFDIPPTYAVGLAIRPTKKLTIAMDVQRILYGDVKSISNTHPTSSLNDLCTRPIGVDPSQCTTGIDPVPASRALGNSNGFGFGWQDQWVYKVGVNYRYNKKWEFRTGYNYGAVPFKKNQVLLNQIAPAVVEHHLTFGATYTLNRNMEISANYTHGFTNTVTCAVNDGCTTMLTQEPGTYAAAKLQIRALGIAFSYKL